MGARRLISGTGRKGSTGARGVEKLANRLDRIRMETIRPGKSQSDSPSRKSVRARHRKYLSAMRRNKRATHEIYLL